MVSQRIFNGADAVLAMGKIREQRDHRDAWPYVHVEPPPDSLPVNQIGSVVTPAIGATAVVLTYTVPAGFRLILKAVLQVFTGGNFVPGDATWTIDVNTPVGVTHIAAAPVQGLTAVPIPLGNWATGAVPWHFERAYEFAPWDVLRSKATNVSLGVGAPNWFVSGFFGYIVPSEDR